MSEAAAEKPPTGLPEAGNVDKIRDILFGSQMSDFNKRFQTVDQRLDREAESLRRELKTRLESLESFVESEIKALASRLKDEAEERQGGDEDLASKLDKAEKKTAERHKAFKDEATEEMRALRKLVMDQSKTILDTLDTKIAELAATVERENADIRHRMTEREMLGSLLMEVGMRLRGEWDEATGNG